MNSEANSLVLLLGQHEMWSRQNPDGGTTYYYYYDEYTWIVGALALAWLTWLVVIRYRRASALRRKPRRTDHRLPKRIVEIKSELSSRYLLPGFSANIHAVGIGLLGDHYCIQVFVSDANEEVWAGSAGARLPDSYRGVPLVLLEMPIAGFLSDAGLSPEASETRDRFPDGIREYQEVIIGGISGANTNLTGQSGTIGYFCTRKRKLPGRKEVHLLSNAHVFADLRKAEVEESDLIMQPSPGEPANNRPIGALVSFSMLKFHGDTNEPNHIDAAIARLWSPHQHKPVLPMIGAVKGYVLKKDIEVGEAARKFGRTTGYTEGFVTSIYFDIRIRYDRTGQSAFFKNQLLIEPALPGFQRFVAKGDSGSLAVDGKQHAIGLIFAGMSDSPESTQVRAVSEARPTIDPTADTPRRIEGYGVANPISEVLDRLKIDLLV
jgi:hypothetical protein